ncbi:MAG: Gfo/Idh/MocA family protein [Opitutales bacterium]
MSEKTWKFAGINFDHMHMGDLLRAVNAHPNAEIAGICDEQPERMQEAIRNFAIPEDRVHTDVDACLRAAGADIIILCPATADHADYVERVAPSGAHVLLEKPFAASLEEADRIITAMESGGGSLMVNWPLRWVAAHVTTRRLIDEGRIGPVHEVHYYDGNRGPLCHGADKIEREPTVERKNASWFYHPDKGGGSLQDYLGYGTTLGTWFHGGAVPSEVAAMVWGGEGLLVDEHSVTIAKYPNGLSKFETRWGTFTDPWTHQPQPKCGFVIKGADGTIASYDYEPTIRVQTRDCPEGEDLEVDTLPPEESNPVAYFIHCLENGRSPDGPLGIDMARKGQRIVDTAFASAREKRVLPLIQ